MGTGHQSNSDRLRTIWTPEMDRYFIDLMLEQVRNGNKIDDHLFSKRAWKHMTSSFNEKFEFQYEKDVLKNRHKTLRNLYKAINGLLSQKGFSWDHTRQMVTADNDVWDRYVKAHPEARSYRIKTVPYYHDLCQIYQTITTEENHNNSDQNPSLSESINAFESLHEIMIDEDFGISISREFADDAEEEALEGGRFRTHWQPPMDRYFVDLMVDQVRKGNRIDGLFRKQAWFEMTESFNAEFGFKYDLDILKNRYKTFRRQYNIVKRLLESEGFFWDDERQMVTADDRVWQDYIQSNSDARLYMTRPVPYYKDLCMICNESSSNKRDDFCEADDSHLFKSEQEPSPSPSPSSYLKRQLKKASCPNPSKKARRRDEGDEMASALFEMATAVSCLRKNQADSDSGAVVVAAIQALPDMDEELILDACDLLEDEHKAKTFLALDVKLRRKWLLRKLRSG